MRDADPRVDRRADGSTGTGTPGRVPKPQRITDPSLGSWVKGGSPAGWTLLTKARPQGGSPCRWPTARRRCPRRVGSPEGDRALPPGIRRDGSCVFREGPVSPYCPLFVGRAINGRSRKFVRMHFDVGRERCWVPLPRRDPSFVARAPLRQLAMGCVHPLRRPRRLPFLCAGPRRPSRWPPSPCGTAASPARGCRNRRRGGW